MFVYFGLDIWSFVLYDGSVGVALFFFLARHDSLAPQVPHLDLCTVDGT